MEETARDCETLFSFLFSSLLSTLQIPPRFFLSKPFVRPDEAPGRVLPLRAAAVPEPEQPGLADNLVEPVLSALPLPAKTDGLGDLPAREEGPVAPAGRGGVWCGRVEAALAVAAGAPGRGGEGGVEEELAEVVADGASSSSIARDGGQMPRHRLCLHRGREENKVEPLVAANCALEPAASPGIAEQKQKRESKTC